MMIQYKQTMYEQDSLFRVLGSSLHYRVYEIECTKYPLMQI